MDNQDCLELLEFQEEWESMDQMVLRASKEKMVLREIKDIAGHQDLLEDLEGLGYQGKEADRDLMVTLEEGV